ncbi:carboxymuconolactone decarboxylase family protein [Nocardioides jiangxiensis]|uniref:Carboxymuconolactone decarboxylase family protein n=1 Tax=Nocardioides jiangxiensis TaxID=3064524 RepID=A0ABT9B562_9ACTN|nr:carboxymuconolactone decarboxylase family protein [Nocardioides sp. WY-20]MDO7868441.1 carboxymuconolactone decarboxylase family protein [Nocardioides sp. WY-20]
MDALYLDKANPDVYAGFRAAADAIAAAARDAGLPRLLTELVSVRVSQVNGCAYCLNVHTKKLMDAGETVQRLGALTAWRETELFDETERAALEIAEAITTLPAPEERIAVEYRVREVLSDAEFAAVSWVAISMNAMNRLSITSRHPVRPPRA